ncbi:hypothetical protein CSKR_109301 [Clonorchis sinensis]|uniref:Uncharacterized protein n=1 Tax=Clonorchis sinensis TaxID=79923 RepID=A0A8T1LZK7_CLOSI|nr:hypothetical protein CSKR_109301 [Clonorchis sinensis]
MVQSTALRARILATTPTHSLLHLSFPLRKTNPPADSGECSPTSVLSQLGRFHRLQTLDLGGQISEESEVRVLEQIVPQLPDLHYLAVSKLPRPKTSTSKKTGTAPSQWSTRVQAARLHSATLLYHPWLSSCQIGKYHINRFSDQTAIVLVDSETSTAADEELASIQDDDQKLLTIANRLNSHIVGLEAAVDIRRDKNGASGNFDFNHEGIPQIRSVLTYCVEVQEVGNVALSRENFDSLKHTLAKQLQSQLKCAAHETTRIVNVIPRRVLDFEGRFAVSAITHFHTKFHPAETGFPEQWKMGLQGVIDSLGVNKGLGINFQLPVYGDFSKHYELSAVFELLKPLSYDCYPSEHFVARDGADLYATVLVQMSISSISVHLGGKEYSDLAFLELLHRKCKWASFSVFTFPDVASYRKLAWL